MPPVTPPPAMPGPALTLMGAVNHFLCVCIQHLCVCVCFWICVHQFPLWLCSLFWHAFFNVSDYVHLPVTSCTFTISSHVGSSPRPVTPQWTCAMDRSRLCTRECLLHHFGTLLYLKELPVYNPITFIPSTFLIAAVENRLRGSSDAALDASDLEFLQRRFRYSD